MNDQLGWSFEAKSLYDAELSYDGDHFRAVLDWKLKSPVVGAAISYDQGSLHLDFGLGPVHFGLSYLISP